MVWSWASRVNTIGGVAWAKGIPRRNEIRLLLRFWSSFPFTIAVVN